MGGINPPMEASYPRLLSRITTLGTFAFGGSRLIHNALTAANKCNVGASRATSSTHRYTLNGKSNNDLRFTTEDMG